jgi:hypothetical protein
VAPPAQVSVRRWPKEPDMKRYAIVPGVVLVLIVLAEVYFGTVFNESVRHPLDLPAMLFVAPGLLLNKFLQLNLSFDGHSHSAVIWISGGVYAALAAAISALVRTMRKRHSRQIHQ